MRHASWVGTLSQWSCQSPVAHSCVLLNHTNNFSKGMLKLNAKFDADSLLYLLSHFECDGHTVDVLTHCPHWLVQWSCHCSHVPFQSTFLGYQVTSMLYKLFSLYWQRLDFSWTDCVYGWFPHFTQVYLDITSSKRPSLRRLLKVTLLIILFPSFYSPVSITYLLFIVIPPH